MSIDQDAFRAAVREDIEKEKKKKLQDERMTEVLELEERFGFSADVAAEIYGKELLDDKEGAYIRKKWTSFLEKVAENPGKTLMLMRVYSSPSNYHGGPGDTRPDDKEVELVLIPNFTLEDLSYRRGADNSQGLANIAITSDRTTRLRTEVRARGEKSADCNFIIEPGLFNTRKESSEVLGEDYQDLPIAVQSSAEENWKREVPIFDLADGNVHVLYDPTSEDMDEAACIHPHGRGELDSLGVVSLFNSLSLDLSRIELGEKPKYFKV